MKKKITDVSLASAKFMDGKQIDGVLTSDKVGEVKFMGLDRLLSEGIKQQIFQGPHGEENDHEESAKTLFGQY